MKNSVVRLVENCHYLTIREEFINICTFYAETKKGFTVKANDCAAALLSLYINLEDAKRLTQKGTIKHQCSNNFLEKCLLGHYSQSTIRAANALLEKESYISIERVKDKKDNNKPNSVILNANVINSQLDKFRTHRKEKRYDLCVFPNELRKVAWYTKFVLSWAADLRKFYSTPYPKISVPPT